MTTLVAPETMPHAVFLDTNILVYDSGKASLLHTLTRRRLAELEAVNTQRVVRRQVFREYPATLNRPVSGIARAT